MGNKKEQILASDCPEEISVEPMTAVFSQLVNQTKREGKEMARVWYEDGGEMKWSQVISGSRHRVKVDCQEIVNKGGFPVIAIHSHLGGGLVGRAILSSSDFGTLLGSDMLKGVMLLHGKDILAMYKTSATPDLDLKEVERRLTDIRQELMKELASGNQTEAAMMFLTEVSTQFGLVTFQGKIGDSRLQRVRLVL